MSFRSETDPGEWLDRRFWQAPKAGQVAGGTVARRVPVDRFGTVDGVTLEAAGRFVLAGQTLPLDAAATRFGVRERFLRMWVVEYQRHQEACRQRESRSNPSPPALDREGRAHPLSDELTQRDPGWWHGDE